MIEESRVKRVGDARTIYSDNVLNEQGTSYSTVHLPSGSINSHEMSPEAEDSPHVTVGWKPFFDYRMTLNSSIGATAKFMMKGNQRNL